MKKLVFVLGIVFSSVVMIAQPTQCAAVSLQAIADQGGLGVGQSYTWIVPSEDVILISPGTDGILNVQLKVNGLDDADGYYEAITGDILEVVGLSIGIDDADIASEFYGYPICGDWGLNTTDDLSVVMTLPVSWLQPIKAEIKNTKPFISFSTAQQINNSHFELEHSQNGRQYRPIGKIEGEGNSNKEIDYEFIHDSPSFGINYYRVKQIDLDGQYSFSNVASVNYRTKSMKLYPNPVNEELIIDSPKDGTVIIYNNLGEKVADFRLVEGQNIVNLEAQESGIYLLRFEDGTVERVVKE